MKDGDWEKWDKLKPSTMERDKPRQNQKDTEYGVTFLKRGMEAWKCVMIPMLTPKTDTYSEPSQELVNQLTMHSVQWNIHMMANGHVIYYML